MDYIAATQQYVADNYPIIVYGKPPISDLPPGSILGTWAYSVPGKMRFILDRTVELAAGVLPADVTRTWIKDEYELPFRRRKVQMGGHYPVPLHARRGNYGDCCYVDIRGAYLKILSLGYDVEYRQGHYIGANPRPVPTQIAANKFCYAIAVSMSGSALSNLSIKGKDDIFTARPYNMYSNPCLFNLAQDTLCAIGSEMLAVLGDNLHYINTDGFIVKRELAQSAINIINSWGFQARIKYEGETTIRGVASWKVGTEETRRFNPNANDFTSKMMDKPDRLWLKKRWQKWTEYTKA